MALQSLTYFYDSQQVRFLEQVVRAFSGFQYMTGASAGNPPTLVTVPCRMATTNSLVANIINNYSSNTLQTIPIISIWQTGLTFDQDRLQNRNFVDTRQVVERSIDPTTGSYTSERGQGYTVQRIMPIPFTMAIQVDILTSNTDQKYQLEEQILTIMCPNFDIQNSENALDWTALTTVYVKEIVHSSKSIPIGTNTEELDILTLHIEIPIWLSPPALLTQQTLIEQIVANITSEAPLPGVITDSEFTGSKYAQPIVTPGMHQVSVSGNIISLLGAKGKLLDTAGQQYSWQKYIDLYGEMKPSSSFKLFITDDIEGPFVTGTVQYNANNANQLIWTIDPTTLPTNTLAPVDAIINPLKNFPNAGGLPSPIEGVRYLLLNDLGPSEAWGQITARYGDIIQYENGQWVNVFSSTGTQQIQYVLNNYSGSQLKWNGIDWVIALDGDYAPGYWRLIL